MFKQAIDLIRLYIKLSQQTNFEYTDKTEANPMIKRRGIPDSAPTSVKYNGPVTNLLRPQTIKDKPKEN